MTYRKLIYRLSLLVSTLLFGSAVMTASPPVEMKLLILAWNNSDDGSYQAIARDLSQIGVPY